MINVWFTLSQDEYVEAQTLFMREQNRKARWWRWPLAATTLIGCALMIVTGRPASFISMPGPVIGLGAMGLLFLFLPILQKSTFKKRFKKESANLTNLRVELSSRGIFAEIPGRGSGMADWITIDTWIEGDQVFMLKSGLLMRVLPKRVFDDEQCNDLRNLLTSEVGGPGATRKAQ